jgi:L-lactate dehydrogenase complex protein LldG
MATSNLIDRFTFTAQRVAATVEKIPRSPEELKNRLWQKIRDEEKVLLAEPDDLPAEFFAPLRQLPNVITNPNESQMASVKIGITDAFAGIARTGSLCVTISKSLGGSISLYCREHIAILDANSIVPRPRDVFSKAYLNGKGTERNFVFITGPSATADMGPLVRGVHGPGKLHIIILE